jgi:lysozyme family protein
MKSCLKSVGSKVDLTQPVSSAQSTGLNLEDERFNTFVKATLIFEGSWSDDSSDPGGATMWGLSERFNPEVADKIRARTLTKTEALKIIKTKYYDSILGINEINPRIGFLVFDAKFHGMKEVIYDIQRSVNKFRFRKIHVDGRWGPETLGAIKGLRPEEVEKVLLEQYARAHVMGASAADRVIAYQTRKGLPINDYTLGFTNRQLKRVRHAKSIRIT